MADVQEVLNNLATAVKELTTLEIVTRVGGMDIQFPDKNVALAIADDAVASAVTRLSMTGDVFTNRTPSVVTGEYAVVGDYHERMVEKSQEIIQSNINFLIGVIKELKVMS